VILVDVALLPEVADVLPPQTDFKRTEERGKLVGDRAILSEAPSADIRVRIVLLLKEKAPRVNALAACLSIRLRLAKESKQP